MEDYLSLEDFNELSSAPFSELDRDAERKIESFRSKALMGCSPQEMLDHIFEAVGTVIQFDRVGLAVQDGEWLRSKWVKSRLPVTHLKVGYAAKIIGSSLEQVLKAGRPRVIGDLEVYLQQHPTSQSTELILKDGMRSSLTFPLSLRDQAFGVVFFSSCKSHAYTLEHMKLLESVAQGMALVVDYYNLHQSNEEAQTQEKAFSRVIHDIRSPLAVITGFTDLLYDSVSKVGLSGSREKFFSVIRSNLKSMLLLTDELSEINRLHRDPFAVRFEPVPLSPFLVDVGEQLGAICSSKGISSKLNCGELGAEFWNFDPARIRRVLENLFSNAVKFSDRGSHVWLKVRSSDDRLIFTVTDQGQGIPEGELPKLFCEFGMTQVRSTEGEKSTGLGLFICREIVRAHGGEINVCSEVNKGSTFEFWIPKTQVQ